MSKHSVAFIYVQSWDAQYQFTGVVSFRYNLPLKMLTDTDSAAAANVVNGAVVQPAKVTLEVVESDAEHYQGWSRAMSDAMAAIRDRRVLCYLSTPLRAFSSMILTELAITRDEMYPDGFSGTLTFTEYIPALAPTTKNDQSSTAVQTGLSSAASVSGSASAPSPFQQLLRQAGISL